MIAKASSICLIRSN